MTSALQTILERQLAFQSALGYDIAGMSDDERVAYITLNYVSIIKELGEALDEVRWKPWATVADGESRVNRQLLFKELVDAQLFLFNLMLAATCGSPEDLQREFESELLRKQTVNVDRQRAQYDGVTTKCPACKRSAEDVATVDVTELSCDECRARRLV